MKMRRLSRMGNARCDHLKATSCPSHRISASTVRSKVKHAVRAVQGSKYPRRRSAASRSVGYSLSYIASHECSLPESFGFPHRIFNHCVTPEQTSSGAIDDPNIILKMIGRRLAVDLPDRTPGEKLPPMLFQAANAERLGRNDRLAPAESLDHESVECVPQSARRTFDGDDPAVDWAICVLDIFGLTGSKLEHQQISAVPAEDLGTLILVSISGRLNSPS